MNDPRNNTAVATRKTFSGFVSGEGMKRKINEIIGSKKGDSFVTAIGADTGTVQPLEDGERRNPFACCQRLPTFSEAAELLVAEALARSNNNQTIAARMLGISQPALSKRLRQREV